MLSKVTTPVNMRHGGGRSSHCLAGNDSPVAAAFHDHQDLLSPLAATPCELDDPYFAPYRSMRRLAHGVLHEVGVAARKWKCNRSGPGRRNACGRHQSEAVPRETATLRPLSSVCRRGHPPEPERLQIQCHAPPRAVQILKKSAFVLMTVRVEIE